MEFSKSKSESNKMHSEKFQYQINSIEWNIAVNI